MGKGNMGKQDVGKVGLGNDIKVDIVEAWNSKIQEAMREEEGRSI